MRHAALLAAAVTTLVIGTYCIALADGVRPFMAHIDGFLASGVVLVLYAPSLLKDLIFDSSLRDEAHGNRLMDRSAVSIAAFAGAVYGSSDFETVAVVVPVGLAFLAYVMHGRRWNRRAVIYLAVGYSITLALTTGSVPAALFFGGAGLMTIVWAYVSHRQVEQTPAAA